MLCSYCRDNKLLRHVLLALTESIRGVTAIVVWKSQFSQINRPCLTAFFMMSFQTCIAPDYILCHPETRDNPISIWLLSKTA